MFSFNLSVNALINTEISGTDFNEIYKGIKCYKFLNDNLNHRGFIYAEGLNIDTEPFNPTGICSIGGLYFCEEAECWQYCTDYGTKRALIEIPNDARVYVEQSKFKADKIFITEIKEFDDIDDVFWIDILPKNAEVLKYIKNQTEELCILAVKKLGCAFKYVNEQFRTEDMCILAIKHNGWTFEYMKEYQTERICRLAVQRNNKALEYVNEEFKTNELCVLAVNQRGLSLEFIDNQTLELCALAVKQNGHALCYVQDQFRTKEICYLAIQQDYQALFYIKDMISDFINELCIYAVEQNGLALLYVKNQTPEICKLAVLQNGSALKYVKVECLTDELCYIARNQ